jgi:hypothetical protein
LRLDKLTGGIFSRLFLYKFIRFVLKFLQNQKIPASFYRLFCIIPSFPQLSSTSFALPTTIFTLQKHWYNNLKRLPVAHCR